MGRAEESTSASTKVEAYVFPVTSAQQRLLFLHELDPHSTAYNIPWSAHLTGELDISALEGTLNEIVRRHEILRTTFRFVDGEPKQIVTAAQYLPLPIMDLSSDEDPLRKAQDIISMEAKTPLNLGNGPMLRPKLLRLGGSQHVLLLTLHHIVFDGWSRGILYEELETLYDAFRTRRASPLSELELQYADFTVWQREYLQGLVLKGLLDYWKRTLEGAPTVLRLPGKLPHLDSQSFPGAVVPVDLPGDLPKQVSECARAAGATPFMVWLAAFGMLLARYSNLDDLLIATPVANRDRPGIEKLIGLFANMLPIRVSIIGNPTFRQLLEQVKETCLGAYAHQDVPFESIVEELQPSRSTSHNPLVQVLFSLQNVPGRRARLGGLEVSPVQGAGSSTAKFDLSFFLLEGEAALRARIEYNTDLFERTQIETIGRRYIALLQAAVAELDIPVCELPILTPEERERALVQWNASAAEYPRDMCAFQLFEQQVHRTPKAIAFNFPEEQISYGQLNHRANQVAHFLRRQGVGRGDRVAVFVERSLDLPMAFLAVQKSGAAYVPLDPSQPPERLRTILEDAASRWILTQVSLTNAIPPGCARVLCLDSDWQQVGSEAVDNLPAIASPEDVMYVIFTSGSTGRPKGVQVPHRSVVNVLAFMAGELQLGPKDVFPNLASCAWDMSVPELYLPLITGGQGLIVRREFTYDGAALAEQLRRNGATVLHATPATWNLLLDAGLECKGLKRVCGADKISIDLCKRILASGGEFYNFFGPTETTVWSTFNVVRSPMERNVIGRPLANTEVYVLDRFLRPVPVGVIGEICIGGEGVTLGYLGDEHLTTAKFVQDPYGKRPGKPLYRTGDLGRYLPDGRIEFCGRSDNQLKIRGFRVELGEIEAVVAQYPSVKECVVVASANDLTDTHIVAYVTAAPESVVDCDALREWTKQRLPHHMIPQSWVPLAALPLSANGKLERSQLPEPGHSVELRGYRGAPHTPLESTLLLAWEQVLGLTGVGVNDNFFDLGGHSLLAVKLIAKIEKLVGHKVPLATLIHGQTVAEMARRLEQGTDMSTCEPLVTELQGNNGKVPFFAIAAPGVRTLGYALLARHLGPEQPFYKVQAQAPVARDRLLTPGELNTLATQYIQGIRTIQPDGPYCIGAMCAGCRISEKMILQLEAAGEKVAFFTVFDTWVIENVNRPWLWKIFYYQQRLRLFWKLNSNEKLQKVRSTIGNRIRRLAGKNPNNRTQTNWQEALWPKNYTPLAFQAPIVLFRRRKQPFYYINDPKMGWELRTSGGIQIVDIDLNGVQHLEIMREPNVQILAKKLSEHLDGLPTQRASAA